MSPRTLLGAVCVVLAAIAQPCAATCTVSAVSLAFGNYDSFRLGPTDSVGNIAVTCVAPRGSEFPYIIRLSTGSGSYSLRTMRAASGRTLNYNLYLGADRSVVWGDGTGGSGIVNDTLVLSRSTATRNYPVYGRVFGRQNVPPGIYTDAIVVTLDF